MQPPGRGSTTAARIGARRRRQLLMAAGGQTPATANTKTGARLSRRRRADARGALPKHPHRIQPLDLRLVRSLTLMCHRPWRAPGRRGGVEQPFLPGALMPFYPVMPPGATAGCAEDAARGLLGQAGVVAVRVADLACPARQGLGRDGRTALVAAGAGRIRSGDLVVWLKPVVVTRAVVRRDGRVQAAGHPADHARLGVAEERLDELCGMPQTIDEIARAVTLDGRVKGTA